MEGLVAVVIFLLLLVFLMKDSKCEVCEAPIYRTKAGYRHKPGHAPGDGHHAVLLKKRKN